MNDIMQGFPPPPEAQVTLANWRVAPFSSWAFHHVREIIPTAEIACNRASTMDLRSAAQDLSGLEVSPDMTLDDYLGASYTDGFLVMHDGKIVWEVYRNDMTAASQHILMSVSKSMLGLLAGILADKGLLDPDAPATNYVPELEATAWRGASVQNILDMRVGILFDEDYLVTEGPIIQYRKSTNWNPLDPGEEPMHLRQFLTTLTEPDGPHGGRFHYVSPNTDLMAWVIERATATRYADLMSEHLWQPAGAAGDACITVDRIGAPRAAGGMCVTLRDLARIGQLIAEGGRHGGRQVVSRAWIADMFENGDRDAWDAGDFAADFAGRPIHYRNKWYVERAPGAAPMAFCVGIHGQNLYVIPDEGIVVAKMSSRPLPVDNAISALGVKAMTAIRAKFA